MDEDASGVNQRSGREHDRTQNSTGAAAAHELARDGGSIVRALSRSIEARDLVFRYRGRGEPVIRGSGLRILVGDRILLEGPSGSGKSTLAALLVGLRNADSGLLLLRGFDRQTLGEENWRRMVVAAPQ